MQTNQLEKMTVQAIFFDFNGVIIDDERLQFHAYQELLLTHGIEVTEEQYFGALGMDDRTFVKAAFERAGKTLSNQLLQIVIEDKTARHRKLVEDELPFFPGIVTFLKASSRHFSLGLVSMANKNEIDYVLDRARIRSLFSVIISADDVSVCKPAGDCYFSALEGLNLKRRKIRLLPLLPRECLVIEDSPPGIQSGASVGMRTLGITNTVSEKALRLAGAEVVTHSMADWTVDAVRHVFSEG